ncbi:CAAD domain-containing protein [Synechococcus sp. GFB01]|uniref:CAAD domain-containing protein n=1 Tax=Synechococcus sp. GFB01 TaxID=1662190 RepID=UPI00128C824D|nr:CAAD domain-containing protein [Synechococcus sp. GFB01]
MATAEAEAEAATVVARTIEVPPLEPGAEAGMAGDEGGEWALLVGKMREWLSSGQLQQIWSQARTPLTAIAALIGVLLLLRIYSSLLGAIDSLPLVPGLLELVGLIWLLRYGVPKLVRRSEREQLINDLKKRRQDFLG